MSQLSEDALRHIAAYVARERAVDEALLAVGHCSSIRMRVRCSVCLALAEQMADEALAGEASPVKPT